MRDILYDLKRTLTGKFTIILLVIIVLITAAFAYGTSANISSSSPSATARVLPGVFETHSGYNTTELAINGYGKPISGLAVSIELYNFSSAKHVYINGTTNSHGYFNKSMPNTAHNYSGYKYIRNYVKGVSSGYAFGGIMPSSSEIKMLRVANPSSKVHYNLFIYYASANNTPMPKENIYYAITDSTYNGATLNESSMISYGSIHGGYYKTVALPLNSTAKNALINVEIFNSTNSKQPTMSYGNVLYSAVSSSSLLEPALSIAYLFLIPLLGIFSAYFYYSKDKASGVLESTIIRPVTKGRLFFSRFLGNALSFVIAILIAETVAELIIYKYTGSLLSSGTFLTIFLGYSIEAIAFAGIIYLISQFLKSQGAILGSGLGLYFILGVFWTTIPMVLAIYVFHINLALRSSLSTINAISAISPSFYPTMLIEYHTGLYTSFGITLFSVVAVGIIWLTVPVISAFLLARTRD